MNHSEVLKNVIYTAHKLFYPYNGYGYDMTYYPIFEFYYGKMFESFTLIQNTGRYVNHSINPLRLKNSTTNDNSTNQLLLEAGLILKKFKPYPDEVQKLVEIYNTTGFKTSSDLIETMELSNKIKPNNYNIDLDFSDTRFTKIFTYNVSRMVDNESYYINTETLKTASQDDLYFQNANAYRPISIQISIDYILKITPILAREMDVKDISIDLQKELAQRDFLFEAVRNVLSTKSYYYIKNIVGMKFVLDCLNGY